MLLLWRDKPVYVSLIAGQCHWLFIHAHQCYSGQLDCNLNDSGWAQQLWTELHKQQLSFNSMVVTFSSEVCRFALLPAQEVWPESSVLSFLGHQIFRQQFPGYEQANFFIATDNIRFRQPALMMAVPSGLANGMQWLKKQVRIIDALPVLARVYNKMQGQKQSVIIYTEQHLSFQIASTAGYLSDIHALPAGFSTNVVEELIEVRLDDLPGHAALFIQPKSLNKQDWQKILQSSALMGSYHQQLNVMSLR